MNEDLLHKFNAVEKFHWWWLGRNELVKNLLSPTHPKTVLDIGCGTGETLTFLKKTFPKTRLFGVDNSTQAVHYSKTRGHSAKRADALHLPYPDSTFDAVLLLDVIEHIKADVKVIGEAKRILKSGGVIVLTAPALQFIWSAHDKNQGHFRRYTRHQLIALAEKNKLHVDFISYFNFFLAPIVIVIRLVSNLGPFKRFGEYDSRLNYQVAYNKTINSLLRFIFISEIRLLKYIRYPFGISITIKMAKP